MKLKDFFDKVYEQGHGNYFVYRVWGSNESVITEAHIFSNEKFNYFILKGWYKDNIPILEEIEKHIAEG